MQHAAALLDYDDIGHGFFGRAGGVSEGIFSSLNCGLGSDDHRDAVMENRGRAVRRIAANDVPLITLYQIHSPDVITITADHIRADEPIKADAMVTRQKNIALGILTADCCPVLLVDNQNGVIGAAHAGWRGALAGVIPNTIKAMQQIGANINEIRAAIGPTIAQESYEVGNEVMAAFTSADALNAKFFIPAKRADHFMFDLPGYAARALKLSGIQLYENLGMDTYPDKNDFFSYRRRTHETFASGQADYGRQLSAIVLR
jgi:YfiH family protein